VSVHLVTVLQVATQVTMLGSNHEAKMAMQIAVQVLVALMATAVLLAVMAMQTAVQVLVALMAIVVVKSSAVLSVLMAIVQHVAHVTLLNLKTKTVSIET
jgi:hypothetical protein